MQTPLVAPFELTGHPVRFAFLDRLFGGLMIVGALLHCMGSYAAYKADPMALLWADSGGIAELFLAALNLLRVNRPNDRTLAWISAAGCLLWLIVTLTFGHLIGNILDPRVLIQATITLALLLLSLRTAITASPMKRLA